MNMKVFLLCAVQAAESYYVPHSLYTPNMIRSLRKIYTGASISIPKYDFEIQTKHSRYYKNKTRGGNIHFKWSLVPMRILCIKSCRATTINIFLIYHCLLYTFMHFVSRIQASKDTKRWKQQPDRYISRKASDNVGIWHDNTLHCCKV